MCSLFTSTSTSTSMHNKIRMTTEQKKILQLCLQGTFKMLFTPITIWQYILRLISDSLSIYHQAVIKHKHLMLMPVPSSAFSSANMSYSILLNHHHLSLYHPSIVTFVIIPIPFSQQRRLQPIKRAGSEGASR